MQLNSGFIRSITACSILLAMTGAKAQTASDILQATDVSGGFVVHIDVGNGSTTADFAEEGPFIVQGLDNNAGDVATARGTIRGRGLYGLVSVNELNSGTLPYRDNVVNLVVSENLGLVPMSEVTRVLVPGGKAYIKSGGSWNTTTKAVPGNIDEWTHFLYDASNNAVSNDDRIGPPVSLQWQGSPEWSRHHDRIAGVLGMVSAGGKVFTVIDEGLTHSVLTPGHPTVVARDAYNGTVLWKRSIDPWVSHLWPMKSGPAWYPRGIVAGADRLFVRMGADGIVCALDPNTGDILRTYGNSATTEEIILHKGTLYLMRDFDGSAIGTYHSANLDDPNDWADKISSDYAWNGDMRRICAINPSNGNLLWSKDAPVTPMTLAALSEKIVFFDGKKVVCLDRGNGNTLWTSQSVVAQEPIPTYITPNLTISDNIVLLWPSNMTDVFAFSLDDGSLLWNHADPEPGYKSPKDLFVVDGKVWTTEVEFNSSTGTFLGRNLHTGVMEQSFGCNVDSRVYWFHHRCHRGKATRNFFLTSRTGVEFVDPNASGDKWKINHWVRGGCLYGILPANGLLYAPPNNCACYMESKLSHLLALASEGPSIPASIDPAERRHEGPVYDEMLSITDPASESDAWPVYRHDNTRSGYTPSPVTTNISEQWHTNLGEPCGRVVVADMKVFVPLTQSHQVVALNARDGSEEWRFTAGGNIDSPPAIVKQRAVFGCRDGYVYCLRASDGELIWRFRAAPIDRRIVGQERVESLWPVNGSVLIRNDVVYAVAGRSMFLDGGLRFCKIDLITGELLDEKRMDHRDPDNLSENLQMRMDRLHMPVALPDILSCDDSYIYMRTQRMSFDGVRSDLDRSYEQAENQKGSDAHLFSATGFLDDARMHRSYWVFGRRWGSGHDGWPKAQQHAPAGRILSFNDNRVYGFGRTPDYYKWTDPMENHLFCADKTGYSVSKWKDTWWKSISYLWTKENTGIHVDAMIVAGSRMYIAGVQDVVDEQATYTNMDSPGVQDQFVTQEEHLLGEHAGEFRVIKTSDGSKVTTLSLPAKPVFDGMAAAYGNVFLALDDGSVQCLGEPISDDPVDPSAVILENRKWPKRLQGTNDIDHLSTFTCGGTDYADAKNVRGVDLSYSGSSVHWEFIDAPESGYVHLKNASSGYYLQLQTEPDATAGGTEPCGEADALAVRAVHTSCGGDKTQWRKVPTDNGFFYLECRVNGYYLQCIEDPDGDSGSDNGGVVVRAVPATCGGEWTQWKETPVSGGSVPAAPDNFTLSAVSTTQINLSWTDNASDESGFKIYRNTSNSKPSDPVRTQTGTSWNNGGLSSGTTYYYWVEAYNDHGSSSHITGKATTNSEPVGEVFLIRNKASGNYLRPVNGDPECPMEAASNDNSDWFRWRKVMNGDYFYLLNVQTDMYFRPIYATDGSGMRQVDQSYDGAWTQWSEDPSGDGTTFFFVNHETGKHIRPQNDDQGSPIQLQPDSWTGDWTRWSFESVESPAIDPDTDYYISNSAVLERLNGNGADGTAQMAPSSWTGNYSQWRPVTVNGAWFKLKCKGNNKYLQAVPCEKDGGALRMTADENQAGDWKLVPNGSNYHIQSGSCDTNPYVYSGGSKGYPTLAPTNWSGNHTQWQFNEVKP
ncbi:MAG: PQQ-binding-like beta-propeller repeat protein [Chitinivibrionales bacterium]|nr:PQQ-binding-like beta-propeller repeat protein [Chitinivibrionales bacterium]